MRAMMCHLRVLIGCGLFAVAVAAAAPAWSERGAAPAAHDHGLMVGVENSHAFRAAESPRSLIRRLGGPPRFRPQSFADQHRVQRFRAFHLPVYADPQGGRYAVGRMGDVAALRQAGLKVILPDDRQADAVCVTLMQCLMAIDAAARASASPGPWAVVLDVRPPPPPRWYRLWPGVLRWLAPPAPEPEAPPSAVQIAREVNTVLSRSRVITAWPPGPQDHGKLALIVRGASGPAPADPPFLREGPRGAAFLPWRDLTGTEADQAIAQASISAVVGVDWRGEDAPQRLSAREAARWGVDVIVLSQKAAR